MTHDIQVGDVVRLTGASWDEDYDDLSSGTEVVVSRITASGEIWAGEAGTVGNSNGLYSPANPEESGDYSVELVSRAQQADVVDRIIEGNQTAIRDDGPGYTAGDYFEPWHADYTDAVNPNHYVFPGGAEVIHISQWLTANAAQAVQYICRSSRIDGKNKGDALEDIEKAIRFLTFEKERLRDANN